MPVGDVVLHTDNLSRLAIALPDPAVVERDDRVPRVMELGRKEVRCGLLRDGHSAGHHDARAVRARVVPRDAPPVAALKAHLATEVGGGRQIVRGTLHGGNSIRSYVWWQSFGCRHSGRQASTRNSRTACARSVGRSSGT